MLVRATADQVDASANGSASGSSNPLEFDELTDIIRCALLLPDFEPGHLGAVSGAEVGIAIRLQISALQSLELLLFIHPKGLHVSERAPLSGVHSPCHTICQRIELKRTRLVHVNICQGVQRLNAQQMQRSSTPPLRNCQFERNWAHRQDGELHGYCGVGAEEQALQPVSTEEGGYRCTGSPTGEHCKIPKVLVTHQGPHDRAAEIHTIDESIRIDALTVDDAWQ